LGRIARKDATTNHNDAKNAASVLRPDAGEFGLSPVARARIAQGIHRQEPSKFDGLLAGPNNIGEK
jgi:hypothetical protein